MKGKGATSLYEVLKSASRTGGDSAAASPAPASSSTPDAGSPQATLQERLAAYKAQKLAEVTTPSGPGAASEPESEAVATAVAEATPPPTPVPPARPVSVSAPTLVLPAPPPPAALESGPVASGPGERVLRLTFNTIAFAALVAVGLLFVAYAVGVQSGRRRAAAEAAVEPLPAPPRAAVMKSEPALPAPPPPPPAKLHTAWLAEWKYGTATERVKADDAVRQLKAALDKAGLKGAESTTVKRGAENRLALCIGRIGEPGSPEAQSRLALLKKFRFGAQTPFAQASYVELPN